MSQAGELRQLLDICIRMLESIRLKDWPGLADLELQRRRGFERMEKMDLNDHTDIIIQIKNIIDELIEVNHEAREQVIGDIRRLRAGRQAGTAYSE